MRTADAGKAAFYLRAGKLRGVKCRVKCRVKRRVSSAACGSFAALSRQGSFFSRRRRKGTEGNGRITTGACEYLTVHCPPIVHPLQKTPQNPPILCFKPPVFTRVLEDYPKTVVFHNLFHNPFPPPNIPKVLFLTIMTFWNN